LAGDKEIIMTRFEERMLRCLSRIAANTEKIAENTNKEHRDEIGAERREAENTTEYEWDTFASGADYESIPEYLRYESNKNMYAFAAGIINSFKEKGSQGVADFIMLHERRRDIQNALDPECEQITWSVEDFETRALEIEEARGKEQIFDRSKFSEALYTMIDRHDSSIGITWESIDYHLEEDCLLTTGEEQ